MYKINNFSEYLNENRSEYLAWKRKNVTLRGVKELGKANDVYGSFGKGLYTVPLGNKSMAKEYGKVYFVVGGMPKNPKIVQDLNVAEIFRYKLMDDFCKSHDVETNEKYFYANTSIEDEMIKLGFDGLIIKGREMVNYKPEDIKYFSDEYQLENYYDNTVKFTK